MRVSVIGGGDVSTAGAERAARVGELLARRGHTVVCGGYGGVMEAACRGARRADGETIGILKGTSREEANPHVTTPVATGLGNARNVLVVLNGDAAVAVDGGPGTLSEIGHALDAGRPVAGLGTHDVPGVAAVDDPPTAVDHVERAVEGV